MTREKKVILSNKKKFHPLYIVCTLNYYLTTVLNENKRQDNLDEGFVTHGSFAVRVVAKAELLLFVCSLEVEPLSPRRKINSLSVFRFIICVYSCLPLNSTRAKHLIMLLYFINSNNYCIKR